MPTFTSTDTAAMPAMTDQSMQRTHYAAMLNIRTTQQPCNLPSCMPQSINHAVVPPGGPCPTHIHDSKKAAAQSTMPWEPVVTGNTYACS